MTAAGRTVASLRRKGGRMDSGPGWRPQAACRGMDTNDFYPRTGPMTPVNEAAIAVCRTCPVRAECLAYAIAHNEAGIWGGLGEKQRAALKRQLRAAMS